MADVDFGIQEEPVTVTLPGGLGLIAAPANQVPSTGDVTRAFLGQIAVVLSPFLPIFNIVAFVKAVMDAFKAVPAALGPPPDPGKLSDAIDSVLDKGASILALEPNVSIPLALRDVIRVIKLVVTGIEAELGAIADQSKAGDDARSAAEGLEGDAKAALLEVAEQSDAVVSEQLKALTASLFGLSAVTGVFDALSAIVPIPAIPTLSLGSTLQEAVDGLAEFSDALDKISV